MGWGGYSLTLPSPRRFWSTPRGVYSNMGNYKSFGDNCLFPTCPR